MHKFLLCLLVGLAYDFEQTEAFLVSGSISLHRSISKSVCMNANSFDLEFTISPTFVTSRRSAIAEFLKLGSIPLVFGPSLPAHAKRARGGLDADKSAVPETREERIERIKKERAEYEERRKQAEVRENAKRTSFTFLANIVTEKQNT